MSLDRLKKLKQKAEIVESTIEKVEQLIKSSDQPLDRKNLKKEEILNFIAQGSRPTQAAIMVGIHYTTLREWMKADPKFQLEIEQAGLSLRSRLVDVLATAAINDRDWKAALKLLEKLFPEEFGEKQTLEITRGEDKKSIVEEMVRQIKGIEAPVESKDDDDAESE
jgi:PDZ domain-containing secreted protein